MTGTKRHHVAASRLKLTRALRQLREIAKELGSYSPESHTIDLEDGSYLELGLLPTENGGKLLGCWRIVRHWLDGRRTIYPVQ